MTRDMVPLDGNAAAGRLGQVFAFEVTMARITCGHCWLEGPLAELRLYGGGAGLVLRCRRCSGVNVRMLETERTANLDFSGTARIVVPLGPGDAR